MVKFLINVILGMVGGCLAFWGLETFREKRVSPDTRPAIASPAAVRNTMANSHGGGVVALPGSVDLREAAQRSVQAVVHVKTMKMGREYTMGSLYEFFYGVAPRSREVPQSMGHGSGVIVSEDGYIITNNHVIDGSDKITVTLNNQKEYEATVVGKDANTDIALLKIDEKELPYLLYGDSDNVELGEWVLAVGNPYNLTSTITAGIISAKARGLGINPRRMSLESFLQTDAAVNPGNSGGALVNAKGELIGINTAIESPTGAYSGYAFAVPVNIARKVVDDLKEFGTVQRAILGISMMELTDEAAKKLGVEEIGGIYVHEVIPGGAAHKAGLKAGDVIKAMNDREVNTVPAFQGQLGKYRPGSTVRMKVLRKGEVKEFVVTLQDSYGDRTSLASEAGEVLGATVAPLSQEERVRYRLRGGVKITALKKGALRSVGLQKGYIIVKINDRLITDKTALVDALKMAENDGVLITTISPRGRIEYFALSLQN